MSNLFKHFYLLCVVTSLWSWFFLAGLSTDYFQELSAIWQLLLVDVIPLVVMIFMAPGVVRLMSKENPALSGFISAFYFSVPFLVYDFIYLYSFKGEGITYLVKYWYLTGFSILPWFVFPVVGLKMKSRASTEFSKNRVI
jgi:hypothetical protein